MKIGLIQMNSSKVPKDNLSALLSYALDGVNQGADFLVSPECSNTIDMNKVSILSSTFFEQDDPFIQAVQAFCREHQCAFLLGSVMVKVADDKLANRSILIDKSGIIIARYDKIHLFDVDLPNGESYRESNLYQAGDKAVTAAVSMVTLGLSICYDLRFPYLYRGLASKGADVLMVPAAFTVPTGKAHWHTLLKARAIETGCYVVAPAQVGMHETGRSTYGHSLVVDPWGKVILDAGGTQEAPNCGIHMVDINLENISKARQKIPSLSHTRPIEFH